MEDIAPKLLEAIQNDFDKKVKANKSIQSFLKGAEKGTATQHQCSLYARELGDVLSDVLLDNITADIMPESTMWWNIINRTVSPMLKNNFELTNIAAIKVQSTINKAEGISVKAISADYPDERVNGLVNGICDKTKDFDSARNTMNEPLRNLSQTFYDSFVTANAAFMFKSGMDTTITRIVAGKACKWCQSLAGVYDYNNLPDDIYRRHDNCRCTVTFRAHKMAQNVWTKDRWAENPDVLEKRKSIGTELDVRKNE